jgi:2',3'-cyclic-nucleotide 2'-phosphodiesterase / 3'-nucleotidase / 5'-nucleotidase
MQYKIFCRRAEKVLKRKIKRSMKRKMLNGSLAAVLALTTVPFNVFPSIAKAEATTAAESTVQLRIMETTDLHANIMDWDYYKNSSTIDFGLARTAELIKTARTEAKNSLLFDNGDLLQGNPLADYVAKVKGLGQTDVHPVYQALNLLGFDAGTLGNHEFNYGLDFLANALEEGIPTVNANVYVDDKDNDDTNDVNKYKPYMIIDKKVVDEAGVEQTIKVGVIGLVTPQIMDWDKANLEGQVKTKDIVATAEKFVPQMKAEGADIVVALAHTGFDASAAGSLPNAENAVLPLSKVAGIDAILFGHKHVVFPGTAADFKNVEGVDPVNGTINGVVSVEAGNWGNNLGVIDLTLEKLDGKWQIASKKAEARPIVKTIDGKKVAQVSGADPLITQDPIIKAAHEETITYVNGQIGDTTAPMYSFFARVQDDPTIQIVNNAQTAYVKDYIAKNLPAYKDVPVLSAGAPFKAGRGGPADYTNIAQGPLSIASANDLYLYPNTLKAVELTGAQVKEWLEMSAAQFKQVDPNSTAAQDIINYSFEAFNFDVIDGLKYEYDITVPAKYAPNGDLINPTSSRVKNLTMADGSAFDPNQKFVVATNNYRASGGGNFPGLKGGVAKIVIDSPDENRQVLIDYIFNLKTINPSADQNWKLAPVGKNVNLTFKSSPEAQAVASTTNNIAYVQPVTDEKGTWGVYSINLGTPVEQPSLIDVQLLGINDLHGQLDTIRTVKNSAGEITARMGGIEYLAAYLKQREATNPNTLMLHAGDMVGASAPVSALLQDEPTIRLLNEIGFDAGTVGNHEFDEGVPEMLRLINGGSHPATVDKYGVFEGADFPYVAANLEYKATGELVLEPYTIKEVGGAKIGIIGVVTTGTPNIVIPKMVEDVKFTDEITAINKYAAELKAKGVKSIVVLAHNPGSSRTDGTNAMGEVVNFANAVDDEVDVIFGGHDHKYLNAVVDGKLLVQSYSYGTAFSDVDLKIDPVTGDIVEKKAQIVDTVHANITPDASVKAEMDAYQAEIAPIFNRVIGESEVELTRAPNPNGSGEQALGNVIADAMRWQMGTDMGFMNPGGIRNDLNAGEITWGELFNIQPFGNDLIKMTVTGDVIRELLNQQWADPTRAKMLQISGLYYGYDDTLPYGSRILDIFLENGTPIDPKGEYTITVNNFMAGGGDGYGALLKGTNKEQGPTDLEGLVNYIQELEGPLYAEYENRFLKADKEIVETELFYLSNLSTYVDGLTDPYASVVVKAGGIVIGEGKADNYGYFDVNISKQAVGTIVTIETTDLFGNSTSAEFEVEEAVTGWQQYEGKWYYIDPVTGDLASDEWKFINKKWYFFNEDGTMKTGWYLEGTKWYYLDAVNGDMKVNWALVNGKWYFFNASGVMQTGWLEDGGKWYLLTKSGAMATGWSLVGKTWYFFDTKGAMKTGWVYNDKKWYFLNTKGAMQTGWVLVNNKWYYLYSNGSMASNTYIGKYKVGSDGAWIK